MVQGTKCTFCDAKFDQNCELEKHVVEDHQQEKEHSCEVCGKKFFLLWMLKGHKCCPLPEHHNNTLMFS